MGTIGLLLKFGLHSSQSKFWTAFHHTRVTKVMLKYSRSDLSFISCNRLLKLNGKILTLTLGLPSDWKMTINPDIPLQTNGSDCGVFCNQILKFEYFGALVPKWTAKDIERLRAMMVLELYEGRLRWRI
jgi:hypothetical protein